MGSSPTSPEPVPPPPGLPREERLDGVVALARAQDEAIALARRHVKVFDIDLSWGGWNTPARCDALSSYLRRMPGARLDIIVHDTRFCSDADFQGTCRTFGPGDYPNLSRGLDNKVSSGRRISNEYPYKGRPNWTR
jgi:hypothetical protein